ncbi:ER membrane protein complex subunit 10 [Vigna radiata var. radiata]|uniref:ER membrane protein complex subunit 10 n=1 Tax=Vigna radiata var. radiata TaxID=3916 RepID=A0A1S3VXS4_VIGRR|nr:ER membrane protein complex subunit 10 [Vigna radiata var. radiata]
MGVLLFRWVLPVTLLLTCALGFQSDELLLDDEEFGIEGGRSSSFHSDSLPPSTAATSTSRKKFSESASDSKIQFTLQHAFGDSDFSDAGNFSARLKTWSHGGQTLTKLRFKRDPLTDVEKKSFQELLRGDDFYRIRLPSNVLSPPGREYIISSVKARCLPGDGLEEHFVIHMEGVNVLAVNYGAPGSCSYPRLLKLPAKWSFKSHTVLKNSEQAPRTPIFAEDALSGEEGDGEGVKPIERSFWAKYWMYLIPLGLILMNAVTQAMNMPEDQPGGQPGAPAQQQQPGSAVQRGASSGAVRRR